MHARLSTYEGQADELTRGFEAQTDPLGQLDGFKAAYFGVSDSGKAFSLTLWESEDALEASAERAKQLRSDATQPSGAEIQSVEHFEITTTAGDA
jgi:heme-degrading monooxygenase HmoA